MNINEQMKKNAKTIMKVVFADGNTVPFYGLGKTRSGEQSLTLELRRHKNLVARYGERVMEAAIYKNRYPDKSGTCSDRIMQYVNGVWL